MNFTFSSPFASPFEAPVPEQPAPSPAPADELVDEREGAFPPAFASPGAGAPTPRTEPAAPPASATVPAATPPPPVPPPAPSLAGAGAAAPSSPSGELVVARGGAPALATVHPEDVEVFGGWGDERDAQVTALPFVTVIYSKNPLHKEHGAPRGWFGHALLGEWKETLDLVWFRDLDQRRLRAAFDESAEVQPPAICVSLDGHRGLGSAAFDAEIGPAKVTPVKKDVFQTGPFAIAPGTACKSCKWAEWRGSKRSACDDVKYVVGVEREWGVVVLPVHGVSLAPWRRFMKAAPLRWAKNKPAALRSLGEAVGHDAAVRAAAAPAQLFSSFLVAAEPVEDYFRLRVDVQSIAPADPAFVLAAAAELATLRLFDEVLRTERVEHGDDVVDGGAP